MFGAKVYFEKEFDNLIINKKAAAIKKMQQPFIFI